MRALPVLGAVRGKTVILSEAKNLVGPDSGRFFASLRMTGSPGRPGGHVRHPDRKSQEGPTYFRRTPPPAVRTRVRRAPPVWQRHTGQCEQHGKAAGFGDTDTCHTETADVNPELREVLAPAPAAGSQVGGAVLPGPAPPTTPCTDNRLVPLPHVAVLVERPIGAGRIWV